MFDKKHVSIGSFSGVRTASKSGTFRKFGGWKSGTVYERKFRSYRDFIDFINRGRPSGVKTQSTANKGMHYHNSWEEAMENVKSGWQEGREKVQEIIDSIDIPGVPVGESRYASAFLLGRRRTGHSGRPQQHLRRPLVPATLPRGPRHRIPW